MSIFKRPHDICPGEDPALFKDEDGNTCDGVGKGASKFDIVQGPVRNHSFLSCANCTLNIAKLHDLLNRKRQRW